MISCRLSGTRSTKQCWMLTDKGAAISTMLCLTHYLSHGWVELDDVSNLAERVKMHEDGVKYAVCERG